MSCAHFGAKVQAERGPLLFVFPALLLRGGQALLESPLGLASHLGQFCRVMGVPRPGTQRVSAFLRHFGVVASDSAPRFARRLAAAVLGVLLVWMILLAHGGPARADIATGIAAVTDVACGQQADASACDADGDRIPDAVEVAVCGSGTCATGREDADTDGIPDWTEVTSCRDVKCADPATDTDADGVPDYAEVLVCGSGTCSNGYEDADGNKVSDWIDYVICGTAGCATGEEDFDHNGVSDAAELAACVKKDPGFLASTGFQAGLWALAGVILLGGGALMLYRKKNKTTTNSDGSGGDVDGDTDGQANGAVASGQA
jgi:LPXTG-motif cell wall-anchored protein